MNDAAAGSARDAQQADDPTIASLLTQAAERAFQDLCTPQALRQAEAEPSCLPALWARIDVLGLTAACAPREHGGQALGWAEVRGLIEACGRAGLPIGLPEHLAAHLLARSAGLDLPVGARLTLALARESDGAVLADAVPAGAQAQAVLVQCGQRLACLPMSAARVEHRRNGAGESRSECRWPEVPPEAWRDAQGREVLLAGAAIRTAQTAGACARVADFAVRYANDRHQFGRAIGRFQAMQQQLAVAAEWSAMAAMASCLALSDPGSELEPDRVSAAREVACTAAEQVSAVAHAVHGAIGITGEYDLQLYTRRLKSWAGEFGSQRYWAARLGTRLLQGRDPRVWDHVIALATV